MARVPIELTLRDIQNSEAIEAKIAKKVEKLELTYHHMEFCKIVIEYTQKHKHQGRLLSVNIEVGVPGKRLVVNHKQDEDLYVAIRDAFAAMKRQLEHYGHLQRHDVKHHAELMVGQVVRLFTDYGFIEDHEGREFYFSDTDVLHHDFEQLSVGKKVRFWEGNVGDGLQASHVAVI